MIPDEVREEIKRALDLALENCLGPYQQFMADDEDYLNELEDDPDIQSIRNAQRWLDKPYSHRNGETEPPEVQGHYWFRGLNTRAGHRVRKWVLGKISKNMQFFYDYGWGSPEEFIGEWHGPIPEPEANDDPR